MTIWKKRRLVIDVANISCYSLRGTNKQLWTSPLRVSFPSSFFSSPSSSSSSFLLLLLLLHLFVLKATHVIPTMHRLEKAKSDPFEFHINVSINRSSYWKEKKGKYYYCKAKIALFKLKLVQLQWRHVVLFSKLFVNFFPVYVRHLRNFYTRKNITCNKCSKQLIELLILNMEGSIFILI